MADRSTRPGATSRKLRWALGISLAVNLVIAGVIGGAVFRFKDADMRPRGPEAHSYATAYVRALPREDRRTFHRALRDAGRDLPDRSERRALFAKVLEALRADTFDADQVRGVLDKQAEVALGMQRTAQEVWLGKVSDMTAADRAAYADRLEDILKRGPRDHRKHRRD